MEPNNMDSGLVSELMLRRTLEITHTHKKNISELSHCVELIFDIFDMIPRPNKSNKKQSCKHSLSVAVAAFISAVEY